MSHDSFARLRSHENVECGQPCDSKRIKLLERDLELTLPESYKAFLLEVGWATIDTHEVLGLGPGVPNHMDVDSETLNARVMFEPLMPFHLVPVMPDGAGNHYCLNTKKLKDGECPVVFWDHEHPRGSSQTPARKAESFAEFLDLLLNHKSDW